MARRVSFNKMTPKQREHAAMMGRVNGWDRGSPRDLQGFPENKAEQVWEEDGLKFSIVRVDAGLPPELMETFKDSQIRMHHYNGYVRFPSRPFREKKYDGIVAYVPVHGGITLAEEDADGSMVYGFDTNHAGDKEREDDLDNQVWLIHECRKMGEAIRILRRYERRYKRRSSLGRAKLLDGLSSRLGARLGGHIGPTMNFSVMVNMLSKKV